MPDFKHVTHAELVVCRETVWQQLQEVLKSSHKLQEHVQKLEQRICTAVFISVDALRALTSMKTAVCCDSLWSPMSDASRQPLCKVL